MTALADAQMVTPVKCRRGQTSAEFLIVFAITLVILVLVFFLVSQQLVDTGIEKENAEVQKTVADLSSAVSDVYSQGDGAAQTVHIVLPSTYDAANSSITNNSIIIKTRDTFHVQNFNFPVYGTLPQAAGAYDVVILSRGNSVYIGSSLFRMSPALVSIVLPVNTNQQRTVTITNLVNGTITVNGALGWGHPEVTLTTNNLTFTLAPFEQQDVALSFSASNLTGAFPGSVAFSANSSLLNDSQVLGLYAEVPAQVQIVTPPPLMTVYPTLWNATVSRGGSVNATFMVCGINTALSSVTFKASRGIPGAFVSGLSPIPVSLNSCNQKELTIRIPHGTRSGTYSGTVVVTGDGTYTSTISLNIQVAP